MLHITRLLSKRKHRREYLYDDYNSPKSTLWVLLKKCLIAALLIAFGMLLMLLSTPSRATQTESNDSPVYMHDISEGSLLITAQSPGHSSTNSPDQTLSQTPSQYQRLPLLHTDVNIHIAGLIARTHIKQRFKNTSNNWLEAIYVFPLPETSAVDHMQMQIGERFIEAQIKEKQQARKIYQQAKRDGKKTALIEQQRANLFTSSVANIGPGETVIIEIHYQQILQYNQGDFSLRLPMAITPRYNSENSLPKYARIPSTPSPPLTETDTAWATGSGSGSAFTWANNTQQLADTTLITPPLHAGSTTINPYSITVQLEAGFPLKKIHSRYHSITQQTDAAGVTHISLASASTPSDRDFELVWTPDTGFAPQAALFNQQINDEYFYLLMVLPPDNAVYNGQPLARQVTYVIDTSGSMSGISIEQARASLIMALERLRLHDRFNIIQFNSVTEQLFTRSQLASDENINLAKKYVSHLQADGGTEMAPALKLAFNQPAEADYVRQIIFLTDGSVSNESELLDIIHQQLGHSRLFTVGIGSAPNSYFMSKAAQFGRGTFTYISDVNEVNEKMTALFSKLENPLLTDLSLHLEKGVKAEIWPQRFADLYQGEPLVLALKTTEPLQTLTLSGTQALTPWSSTLTGQQGQSSQGIGGFWARSKIDVLMDSLHEGADPSQVRTNVINLALTHHLVSKYTSLVAVEITPSRGIDEPVNTKTLAVNLPHGQQTNQQAVFGRLPQTATSAEFQYLFGFSLLILALLSQWVHSPIGSLPFVSWSIFTKPLFSRALCKADIANNKAEN